MSIKYSVFMSNLIPCFFVFFRSFWKRFSYSFCHKIWTNEAILKFDIPKFKLNPPLNDFEKIKLIYFFTFSQFWIKQGEVFSETPGIVYGVYCTGCPKFYVGKTKRHLEKRFKEHKDLRKQTAVTKHLNFFWWCQSIGAW